MLNITTLLLSVFYISTLLSSVFLLVSKRGFMNSVVISITSFSDGKDKFWTFTHFIDYSDILWTDFITLFLSISYYSLKKVVIINTKNHVDLYFSNFDWLLLCVALLWIRTRWLQFQDSCIPPLVWYEFLHHFHRKNKTFVPFYIFMNIYFLNKILIILIF